MARIREIRVQSGRTISPDFSNSSTSAKKALRMRAIISELSPSGFVPVAWGCVGWAAWFCSFWQAMSDGHVERRDAKNAEKRFGAASGQCLVVYPQWFGRRPSVFPRPEAEPLRIHH